MLFLQTMIYDTLFEAVITFKKKKINMRHYLGYVSDNPLNLLFTCLKITHGKQWKLTNISILDDPRGNAGSCIYL